ncbi:hypothetical protein MJO28_005706 [Puccinia striiformis f. sp. tritici]|uniref:Uncharacterized protein n=1 Tax=Puccinia striiformis f. sp. tritici TaxID=168172 RepID=A0ACC0EL36_9BASI|nr:hypothetical protein MJO28_005706 [Puccinia striiformis f. sp. tritici]
MASRKSIEILGIDEEELLKTYKLSSLKPSKWEEVDPSTKNPQDVRGLSTPNSTQPSKGEDDPLGMMRGPILRVLELNTAMLITVIYTNLNT